MHFTLTLIFHIFFRAGQNIKDLGLYILQGQTKHHQLVGGWGMGARNHDVVECALQEAKWIG